MLKRVWWSIPKNVSAPCCKVTKRIIIRRIFNKHKIRLPPTNHAHFFATVPPLATINAAQKERTPYPYTGIYHPNALTAL